MSEQVAVGIVLISHSRALAEGAADVAGQVSAGAVRIVAVGGTDDGRLGTSADALAAAVDKVSGGAGVLVIADLGSSVLTAKAYLVEHDHPADVQLADAPFVEGAVSAAVTASCGASLAEVLAAAEGARGVSKL
ncbi:MAG TPA: dihydroxyacetone kinase phosphoryl donor subunit DhaM [Actinomycetes bacterium]|jgi:dihydroxyacetone kinase phosphotransfer subunit|nr:dihydroxyacetone kinase phosphoryl donor subunit DhaM [Actinomycetes bacterium]